MVRKICVGFCIALLFSLSGCAENLTVKFNEAELTDLSKTLSRKLVDGEFETVYEQFADDLKNRLPLENLKKAYEDTTSNVGEFIDYYSANYTVKSNLASVDSLYRFENSGLIISLTYGVDKKLTGIWLRYAGLPEPVPADANYKEIPISFGYGETKLDGLLCLPYGEVTDVAILVQGSGVSDLNEFNNAIGPNTPFKDIALGLAQKGIATIRFNKRFYQYPTEASEKSTVADEVLNDVFVAVKFAENNEYKKFTNITVIGHSLGGMLAPKIAADNPAVTKIISLAGTPRKLEDVIFDQNIAVLKASTDKTQAEKDKAINELKAEVQRVKNVTKGSSGVSILGVPSFYWASLNKIDTPEILKTLDIPMLFMQGDKDFQISKETDFAAWQSLLKGNPNATFISYPDLNHFFMPSKGKSDISDYAEKDSVASEVIENTANWILSD